MPYPTPYDVPDEARKMALYQSLLGMGSQMLQPKPYKTGLMGDIGNAFGAANQGMSNMGSLLGNYQEAMQKQELMKLKQAEDIRQQQMQTAQIPLIQAQTQNQLRQAQPEQTVPFNGMNVPLSKLSEFSSLLGANTRAQAELRQADEAKNLGIGNQNLGILQDPSQFTGMSPNDERTARGAVQRAAMQYNPKETIDWLKGMKEKAAPNMSYQGVTTKGFPLFANPDPNNPSLNASTPQGIMPYNQATHGDTTQNKDKETKPANVGDVKLIGSMVLRRYMSDPGTNKDMKDKIRMLSMTGKQPTDAILNDAQKESFNLIVGKAEEFFPEVGRNHAKAVEKSISWYKNNFSQPAGAGGVDPNLEAEMKRRGLLP